jgi:hypothetical protein
LVKVQRQIETVRHLFGALFAGLAAILETSEFRIRSGILFLLPAISLFRSSKELTLKTSPELVQSQGSDKESPADHQKETDSDLRPAFANPISIPMKPFG